MLLDATGINVRYGRNHAVRDVDLSLEKGEVVTVLGANGAGKSSLLKAISGTEKADGSVVFDGEDISGWSAPRRVQAGLVLVPEGSQIFVSLTVQQQMLAFGRAMLARPKLMMLDEPSLGLSPILVSQLFKLIKDLNQEGLTMILVEQNTNMALATATRGYVLELGAVVLSGPSSELASDSRLEEAYLGG